ncbi:hypothetical protein D3C83_33180 [compost metagenome]
MAFSCEGSEAVKKDITVQRLGLERKARAQHVPAREPEPARKAYPDGTTAFVCCNAGLGRGGSH